MRTALAFSLVALAACGCAAPEVKDAVRDRKPFSDHLLPVPADAELQAQIERALDLKLRRDFDRFLDAREPGELLEHAVLTQKEIEKAGLGIEALFIIGDELFDYEFRPENGLGNGLAGRPDVGAGSLPAPNLRRVHQGEFGGPDSHNCSSCHLKGGVDGAGQNTQNAFLGSDGASTLAADARNPPHLLGLGPVEALAREMTADLAARRDQAIAEARLKNEPVEAPLTSKAIDFGFLRALPDGTVDTSRSEGIDPDLVVKPFGWKGHQATLRGMVEESFRIHLGLVSMCDQERVRDGQAPPAVYGDGVWYDADRDGATLEVDEGMLTTLVVYLAQLEAPVIRPPRTEKLLDYFARGAALFREAKCDGCHRPSLELRDPVLEVRPRGVSAANAEPIRVDVARDGDQPKIEPQHAGAQTAFNVRLFSDLKRHDLGPDLATPGEQAGIPRSVFLTRPLWGLAFTAPYLHDGRAPTIDDAIRLHGGEAAASRDLYLASPADDRAALQVFLISLTREPKLAVLADAGSAAAAPDGLGLEAAREAHRRAELRRHLQFLEAVRPGALVRSTAERVPQERIDRGEVAPADLHEAGRLLFEHEYGFADGLGNVASRRDPSRSPFRRVHEGRSGGPDTTGCGSCHWRGGLAGAGGLPDQSFFHGDGDRIDSADGRNPPPLQGSGAVQVLAREMSAELQAIRARLVAEARRSGRRVEGEITAKGIRFGVLRVGADGTVDGSGFEGVDADLVVKPFGWKGTAANLREFVAESLQVHHGIQSEDLVSRHRREPDPELVGAGPDPDDPDGDGVRRELTSGQLTALESFLALLALPVVRPPEPLQGMKPAAPGLRAPTATVFLDEWAQGRRLFHEVGCASCHTPMLVLREPVFRTRSAVTGGTLEIDLSRHGDPPRLRYDPELEGYPVWLFSDLKRHDLGEENAARHAERGVAPRLYLTRRLWGLADSPPYMYDGRAPWLDHAIAAHRGEASPSSIAFEALEGEEKAALRVYLLSLRREPRLTVP